MPCVYDIVALTCPLSYHFARYQNHTHTQVGVQTMIEPNAGATALEDKVNAAHPILVGSEEDGGGGGGDNNDKDQDEGGGADE